MPSFSRLARFVVAAAVAAGWARAAAAAPLAVGTKPPAVTIKDDDGAKVDGSAWSSDSMLGKVALLLYVDPDKRDANEAFEAELKKADLPHDKFQSVAVINMDASWLPNGIIASSLASKQEKYPNTVYVKDLKKVLVDKWKLTDDEYVAVVFDRDGKVAATREGAIGAADTKTIIDTLRKLIDAP
jgi:predicted transcriptional regulator